MGVSFTSCTGDSRTIDVKLPVGDIYFIAELPKYALNARISVNAQYDLDVMLMKEGLPGGYEGCMAGFNCDLEYEGTMTIDGMEIYFSGDDYVAPVSETVGVPITLTSVPLYVKAYDGPDGLPVEGTVEYSCDGLLSEECGWMYNGVDYSSI